MKTDHLPGLWFVGCGGWDAAEVSVFEAVAVAFEGDDFGVVDKPVDHGGGHDVVRVGVWYRAGDGVWWMHPHKMAGTLPVSGGLAAAAQ